MPHTLPASSHDELIAAWPGAVLVASADGTVRTCNDEARRLLRLAERPLGGVSLATLFGAAAARSLLPEGGAGGECSVGEDATPAGRPVIHARSSRLPGGEFVVRLDDASDEYRLRSHLEHAERLASIGELLASVAHELSNPLTTVLGYADLLLTEDSENLPRAEIEQIRSEALRCRRIVANLLDLSRAEPFEMRPVSLAQVVDKVMEYRTYACQVARIQLVREPSPELPAVNGDLHRLVQSVLNLVTNAEDAVRDRPGERSVTLRTTATAAGAAVEVEDTGPGVPEALREFVFEPFFTTKPRGRGTGLGLSLVRATAQAHGGTIRLRAAPGGGALFVMELPAAE